MVSDGRNHHRIAQQIGATDFLNPAQLFALDRAEFGEVHFRPRYQSQTCAVACRRFGGLRLCARFARHDSAAERLDIFLRDTAFGSAAFDFVQWHAEFTGEFANRRRRMR